MPRRASSLALAIVIVAIAMVGATGLQESRRFPWHVFVGVTFPALAFVAAAGGGAHEISGEAYVGPAIFVVSVLMWWGIIESGRHLWRKLHSRPTPPDPCRT